MLRHRSARRETGKPAGLKRSFHSILAKSPVQRGAANAELLGGPANAEALAAFAEGREPDFTSLPPGW